MASALCIRQMNRVNSASAGHVDDDNSNINSDIIIIIIYGRPM